jgi:hypothetical protein
MKKKHEEDQLSEQLLELPVKLFNQIKINAKKITVALLKKHIIFLIYCL